MRVTIEHREESSGLTGRHKECYIDCRVEFSEEERAIIKARNLYRAGVTLDASTPLPSNASIVSTGLMRYVAPFMIVGGFLYGLIGEGIARAQTNIAGPMIFLGIAFFIVGWVRSRKIGKRLADSGAEQTITIKQLLGNPKFTVYAWTPATAKGLEHEIREKLVTLKNIIVNSAELEHAHTFDL